MDTLRNTELFKLLICMGYGESDGLEDLQCSRSLNGRATGKDDATHQKRKILGVVRKVRWVVARQVVDFVG